MVFKNEALYDLLKSIGRIVFPALTALWVALSEIWKFPCSAEIAGTMAAVTTFLNAVLEIGNAKYNVQKKLEDALNEELDHAVE